MLPKRLIPSKRSVGKKVDIDLYKAKAEEGISLMLCEG